MLISIHLRISSESRDDDESGTKGRTELKYEYQRLTPAKQLRVPSASYACY